MTDYLWYHWYENEKPGWHHIRITRSDEASLLSEYAKMVTWVNTNIDNSVRHARWRVEIDGIDFKFRYERDFVLFTLRWS